MEELIDKVIKWAEARNIFKESSITKQLDKTSEEFNELQRAVGTIPYKQEYYCDLGYGIHAKEVYEDVIDAYGDILVTLIIASKMQGIDLKDALASAYDVIKDRKGVMINGKFVKEESL